MNRRRRAADAAYAAVGALTVTGTIFPGSARPAVGWLVASVVVQLAAVAALVLHRRRHPVAVAVGCLPLLLLDGNALLALAVFALAIRRRDRVLWLVGAAGVAIAGLASLLPPEPGDGTAAGTVGSVLIQLAIAIPGGAFVGARRDLLTSLRDRAEQAEANAELRARQTRLAERTRIAREMHDVVAHRISLVALHAGALEVNPGAGPQQVERTAATIGVTARQALEELRTVLGVLRAEDGDDGGDDGWDDGAELRPQPTLADLPRLVELSAQAGVAVRLDDPAGLTAAGAATDDVVGRTVYRVVQEALTNVHKHARHTRTVVTVQRTPGGGVAVEVANVQPVGARTDDGTDSGPIPGAGSGLTGLRERVRLAGGRFEAGPGPQGGWRVRAEFDRGGS